MVLSHSKKFIFIHIYKVAGTSLSEALAKYNIKSIYMFRPYRYLSRTYSNILPNPYPRHISALDLKNTLKPELFESYFKFAFVRNPWDWQVSLYKFAQKKKNHHQRKHVLSLGSFDNYLKWSIENKITQQKDFIFEGDKNLMDFVGKMENLQQDFNTICDRIGIERVELKHLNKTNHSNYREYYTPETRDLVYKCFKDDIKLFDYEF